jgi:ferredoxin-like protein FixX
MTAIDSLKPITVNIDESISFNKYNVDEDNAHIELVPDPDDTEFAKLMRVCPAGLYKVDSNSQKLFDYAGCLECGTCRIACADTIIQQWRNPAAAKGVFYRFG